MIVIDTHVLVWLAEGNARLGRRALGLIDRGLRQDALWISAFSFWELAMLALKKRVRLEDEPAAVRRKTLAQGIREIPVSGDIALAAAALPGFHGDPADRIIVATALSLHAALVTADERILDWSGGLKTLDARR